MRSSGNTSSVWDPLALDEQCVRLLVKHSPSNEVLVLDDTGLHKQGKVSVGVQHQYSGTLGKQGTRQIVVSAEYVVADPSKSQAWHWPVSACLNLPEVWTEDRPRCRWFFSCLPADTPLVLATLDIRSQNRHVSHDGTNFLAEACEMRVQSTWSILFVLVFPRAYLHTGEVPFVLCLFISIKQRVCFSFYAIQKRFSHWIRPPRTSLLRGTLADMPRGTSALLAENAL